MRNNYDFFHMNRIHLLIGIGTLLITIAGMIFSWNVVFAESNLENMVQAVPLHPTFPLLDRDGNNVLATNTPVSTMKTCGSCHDTEFITTHSYHSDVGISGFTEPGEVPNGRPWDASSGLFGRWNPMTYRYLSPVGDDRIDLSTAEWLQYLGARHVGGGPGEYSREGEALEDLSYVEGDPETTIVDPRSGELIRWDWSESGIVEMNCFLCHNPVSNNDARINALKNGEFAWTSTATLIGSGIVNHDDGEYRWNPAAFDDNGELLPEFVLVQDPGNKNCGQCHGLVHGEIEVPIVITSCSPDRWETETTGQIISSQRISDTGMNLKDKELLTRPWDIHAERLVECTDCHYALNNPIYYQEVDETRPEHLEFDPRRMSFGEYLQQPVHQFARGQSAQNAVAPELKDTMRRCESCHSIDATHDWLPYKERHMDAISCETCHIPKMYAFARQQYDWTVIRSNGEPRMACRGIDSDRPALDILAVGFDPVLLSREDVDGNSKLAPYNLITSWYWIYGDPPRPVAKRDLEAVWLDGSGYHDDILDVFDQDRNGDLSDAELKIDTQEKESFVAEKLKGLGLENPRITGEIQPYSINHTVATGEWVTKDCETCHSADSKLTASIELATYIPGGVSPTFVSDSNVVTEGKIVASDAGKLYFKPDISVAGRYILGYNKVKWVDTIGIMILLGTLLAVLIHGGMRLWTALTQPKPEPELKRVYMYSVYERFWHWLQTFVIFGLIFTGLIIHKPELLGFLSFRGVVLVHNVLAGILVINAFLALFYHVASGEIRQYIPKPHGFFDQAMVQAKFYLNGIFKGKDHPFEKTPDKKLNPLQQLTYFGLLNVLLPLQVITGAMIWGAQRWPNLSTSLGGLQFLSPLHTLITWLLAAFIVAHVYLTTTGHSPTTAIQAMMNGWDEIEVPDFHVKEVIESDHDYSIPDSQRA